MRDNYNISEAEVETYLKYNSIITYDVKFKYEDENYYHRETIDDTIRYKLDIKRKEGFKKIQAFFNTQKGKDWLSAYIKNKESRGY